MTFMCTEAPNSSPPMKHRVEHGQHRRWRRDAARCDMAGHGCAPHIHGCADGRAGARQGRTPAPATNRGE